MTRAFRRFIIWFFVLVVVLLAGTALLASLYQEEISQHLVARIKQQIKGKIAFETTSFDYFTKPGELTLTWQNLTWHSHTPEASEPLLEAENIYFSFQWFDLLLGQFKIKRIYIEKASFHPLLDSSQERNYTSLFQPIAEDQAMQVEEIIFKETDLKYENQQTHEIYRVFLPQAHLKIQPKSYGLAGELIAEGWNFRYTVGTEKYWQEPQLALDVAFTYNHKGKVLLLDRFKLRLKKGALVLNGKYFFGAEADEVDLKLISPEGSLNTLMAFLPTPHYQRLSSFKTAGKIQITGKIQGRWSATEYPSVEMNFNCNKIAIRSPHNIQQVLHDLSFRGKFTNGAAHSLASSQVSIDQLQGKLAGRKFRGSFFLKNLQEPFLDIDLEAGIDLRALNEFYPLEDLEQIKGLLGIRLDMQGYWEQLTHLEASNEKTLATGSLELEDLSFQTKNSDTKYQDWSAQLSFNNREADVSFLKGKIDSTDIHFQGIIRQFWSYLQDSRSELSFTGMLKSKHFDLKPLLKNKAQNRYHLVLPAGWNLSLACQMDSLRFRQFKATQVFAKVRLNDQILSCDYLEGKLAQGELNLIAQIDARVPQNMDTHWKIRLKDTDVAASLEAFENLNQALLSSQQLTGRLNAQAQGSCLINANLATKPTSLHAQLSVQLNQGSLQNLSFTRQLAQYLSLPGLAEPVFDDLQANLKLKGRSLYIPSLAIKTSEQAIFSLFGQASLEGDYHYWLTIPIPKSNPPQPDSLPTFGRNAYYLEVAGNAKNQEIKPFDAYNAQPLEAQWQTKQQTYQQLFGTSTWPDSVGIEEFKN